MKIDEIESIKCKRVLGDLNLSSILKLYNAMLNSEHDIARLVDILMDGWCTLSLMMSSTIIH